MKKKVLLIHTGGTIAMAEDEQSGSVVPSKEHPLNSISNFLDEHADVTTNQLMNVPSPHMTPGHMLQLAQEINKQLCTGKFDGVVLTHGTDTLEETAYMLDLLLNFDAPIIVTGAMRSSNELSADGPLNLVQSVRVAASDEARGKGVLVVFNDEIHTAKNVTKTHTSNISTFQSPQYGPLGIITKHHINFHHVPLYRETYDVNQLTKNVILLKAFAGMDEQMLLPFIHAPVDGLVIEAFGQGNLPPTVVPTLQQFIDRNIPVVLVSRCFNGIVEGIYGYDGGGKQLYDMGIIFTNGLTGPKARLKLMVALESTTNQEHLHAVFLK